MTETITKQYLDMDGLTLYDSKQKERVQQQIQDSAYDDTELKTKVTANETAIAKLNGIGEGSVKKQIDDAFNDFATKISDDNVVNTYKELIDYCATHSAEAAEMAGNIQDNATAISELEAFIGTLPEGTSAATVIAYINEKVASVDFTDAIATAKSEAISTAASDATAKSNKALDDAKSYTDNSVKTLADGAVATNASEISTLISKVNTLESVNYTAITEDQINALFA